jgi:molybdopterin-guanine dinucleotide biosynthesis protein A
MPVDSDGFKQPLCGIYRRDSLLLALGKLGDLHGQSMRALCNLLIIDEIKVEPGALIDIDTLADLNAAHELN